MANPADLDQGGVFRQTQRVYLGPSVGYVQAPSVVTQNVTTGGTTTAGSGVNDIRVDVASAVTIQLLAARGNLAGPQAVPGSFVTVPLTISDIGGNARLNNITILPAAGETIDGQPSIDITSDYGVVTISPDVVNGGWTQTQ